MRTLLLGVLVTNLAGCSHQLPTARTAADSCASSNRLACFMSVRVSLAPSRTTTASATLQGKPLTVRKAREAAAASSTTKQPREQM